MELNPYSEWLAIPPAQTPPTHYRLLGLKEFENDTAKIHSAALDQMARLRVHQVGEHVDLTQKLMNEVSLARVVLCDPAKKTEYDRVLRGGPERPPTSQTIQSDPEDEPSFEDEDSSEEYEALIDSTDGGSQFHRNQRLLRGPLQTVVQAAMGTVILLGLIAAALFTWQFLARTEITTAIRKSPAPEIANLPHPNPAETISNSTETPPVVTPDPPDPAPIETSHTTQESPPKEEIHQIHEFDVAWESTFDKPVHGIATPFDQPLDLGSDGLTIHRAAPGRSIVFWPATNRDLRILIQVRSVELPSPGDALMLGAVDSETNVIAATVRHSGDQWTLTPERNGVGRSAAESIPGQRSFWICAKQRGMGWQFTFVGEDGSQTELPPIAAARKPVALFLSLESRSAEPARAVLAQARLESSDPALTKKLSVWPAILQPPTGASRDHFFSTPTESSDGRSLELTFDFTDERQFTAWKGIEADGDKNRIRILPGAEADFGPIRAVREIEINIPFSERSTKIDFEFAEESTIRLDAEKQDIRINGQRIGQFSPSIDVPIRVVLYDVDESGAAAVTPEWKGASPIPIGRPRLRTVSGDAHLNSLKIVGNFDFESLWLARLGYGDSGDVVGSYQILRRRFTWPGEFVIQPGEVRPIEMANTAADEVAPYLASGGLDLYFCRDDDGRGRLGCVKRAQPNEWFDIETLLTGQQPESNVLSVALSKDERSAFVVAQVQDQIIPFQCRRRSRNEPFDEPRQIEAEIDPVAGTVPIFHDGGLRLLYTRDTPDGSRLAESIRSDLQQPFPPGTDIGLAPGFQHPTVTDDQLTIYVEGPAETGKSAIYRATRPSRDTAWSEPVLVDDLQSDTSKRGDRTPFVSPDGTMLFFASDRTGGAGGLDLWVTRIDTTKREVETPVPAQSSGIWLTLGPIPIPPHDLNKPVDELQKYFPRDLRQHTPKEGDVFEDMVWTRSDYLSRGPGLYLVAYTFDIDRLVQDGQFKIERCPGGAYFWFNLVSIKFPIKPGLGQRTPWEPLGEVNQHSDTHKFRKTTHSLSGIVCVPAQSDGKLSAQILDARTQTVLFDIKPTLDN